MFGPQKLLLIDNQYLNVYRIYYKHSDTLTPYHSGFTI